jgi:hypothetical protein
MIPAGASKLATLYAWGHLSILGELHAKANCSPKSFLKFRRNRYHEDKNLYGIIRLETLLVPGCGHQSYN